MLEKAWYEKAPWLVLLLPVAWLFRFGVSLRRYLLERFVQGGNRFDVPVVVIGNVAVGGTGKTPFLITLAGKLIEQGVAVGVVSRGYGGKSERYPLMLDQSIKASEAGDEPVMIYQRLGCPVVVDPMRVRAVNKLISESDCQIILSDDGLQHYAMPRDLEIAVVDSERQLGNGYCLPAGPLRESVGRLSEVDMVVMNGKTSRPLPVACRQLESMQLIPLEWVDVASGERYPVNQFPEGNKVHGLAGIGNPGRFFNTLAECGLEVVPHAFSDHHSFCAEDLEFDDDLPVVMTEKDAVKCGDLLSSRHRYFYLKVEARFGAELLQHLLGLVN
jgi:tetraacyldisaccharide 4'-kinase